MCPIFLDDPVLLKLLTYGPGLSDKGSYSAPGQVNPAQLGKIEWIKQQETGAGNH